VKTGQNVVILQMSRFCGCILWNWGRRRKGGKTTKNGKIEWFWKGDIASGGIFWVGESRMEDEIDGPPPPFFLFCSISADPGQPIQQIHSFSSSFLTFKDQSWRNNRRRTKKEVEEECWNSKKIGLLYGLKANKHPLKD
jgi:hypothetical protein